MQLRPPHGPCPSHVATGQGGGAVRCHTDTGLGHEHDPAAAEARANTQVETLVGIAERRVGLQMTSRLGTDEHAANICGEDVFDAVVLSLVELIGGQFHRAPVPAHADAE